jgi:formate-dependent nitrite reductase membrane component NrfD
MSPGEWPSTLFTAPTHWRWLIVGYFFIGGLAGGSYFLAALSDLFGERESRALARLGYYVAFPAVCVCGLLLILDLGQPLRFWHMLFQANTGRPMLKLYSPMSLGAWALLVFGLVALLGFLAALSEAGRLRWTWPRLCRPPGLLGGLVTLIGGTFGLFVAGYTGVLLAVTNRPIWSDTPLLGINFVISAASTSAALLILLARRRRLTVGVHALLRFDTAVLALELVALVALLVSLGSMLRLWLSAWGALLFVGVILAGIVIPLLLQWRARPLRSDLRPAVSALLVLVGGFIFRVVVILSAEGIGRSM